jgi:hypothetical protein
MSNKFGLEPNRDLVCQNLDCKKHFPVIWEVQFSGEPIEAECPHFGWKWTADAGTSLPVSAEVVSVIRCACGQPTQLPLSSPEKTFDSLQARIADDWQLDFICPHCKRRREYRKPQIELHFVKAGVRFASQPGTLCGE